MLNRTILNRLTAGPLSSPRVTAAFVAVLLGACVPQVIDGEDETNGQHGINGQNGNGGASASSTVSTASGINVPPNGNIAIRLGDVSWGSGSSSTSVATTSVTSTGVGGNGGGSTVATSTGSGSTGYSSSSSGDYSSGYTSSSSGDGSSGYTSSSSGDYSSGYATSTGSSGYSSTSTDGSSGYSSTSTDGSSGYTSGSGSSSVSSGGGPDPDSLLITVGTADATCAEPQPALACGENWDLTIILPPALQTPGVYNLGDPDFIGFYTGTGPADNPMDPDDCWFGGGTVDGTVEVVSIDADMITIHVAGVSFTDYDVNGTYDVPRCQ